jgi:hypothetical protein
MKTIIIYIVILAIILALAVSILSYIIIKRMFFLLHVNRISLLESIILNSISILISLIVVIIIIPLILIIHGADCTRVEY